MSKWISARPVACQICGRPFSVAHKHRSTSAGAFFIDGRTTSGPWAIMCKACHKDEGVGLGTGRGQRYDWNSLEKVEG